ncbi:DUF349 domain-containing protein [Corynebacterium sp. NML130628]|uniref:DUF349 domain-containing protein n=1 Tax=Corynebacterium sp. NML130628 TaxID=1906333 RepID=UPI0008FB07A1|nr:DUF349 domain-containing protein [Corynebacterium sp. NML130628]OIR45497.1 DNA repair ATPase [Corynebacterium sp. NML130628]
MTPSTPKPQPAAGRPNPAAMPKQTPKPGPRPGVVQSAASQRVVPLAHAQTSSTSTDPSKFGRVDAEGNVFVTRDGVERQIASWQAGTPEEGLRHYGQRFDDLIVETEVLEARLTAHPEDAHALQRSVLELKDSLNDVAAIGDFAALEARLEDLLRKTEVAEHEAKELKVARRANAITRKETLAAEAEQIAESSTDWKAAGDRIRAILEEWKTIRGIDRKTDDELWKRYSRARDAFNRRRGAHFAELDRNRATARKVKEDIVARAQVMQESTDWSATARAYRSLMDEWKAAGRAPRGIDDELWAQFRAAQDHFFAARNAVNAERDREFEANAAAKDALIEEFDALITPEKGLGAARAKLRELQEKWDKVGFVPRNKVRTYEEKIARLEQRVADAEESRWRKADPEAQARVNQFQEKADLFLKQAQEAEAAGKASKAAKLREQAEQWQEFANVAAKAVDEQ